MMIAVAFVAVAFVASARNKEVSDADAKKAEYIYLEATNALTEGKVDDYYMLLRRASALTPDDPYIAGAMAEAELTMTNDSLLIEDAYVRLAKRFEASPTEQSYYTPYVNMARYLGRYDDVVAVWALLDSILPSRTDPAMELANALLMRYNTTVDRADFDRAIAIYDRLESTLGPTLTVTAQKVQALAMRKDTIAAERSLAALAKAAPGDVDANIFIGQVFEYFNKPDSALRYFNRAEAADTTNGAVYLARAEFFHAQGDSVAYDREVFRALKSQNVEFPEKMQLLSDYVVKLYTDSLQRPRIDQMFETLLEVNPGEASLHALYGGYKGEIADYAGAAEQAQYSLDLDPNQHQIWINLLSANMSLMRSEEIVSASRKSLNYYPGDPLFVLYGALGLAQRDSTKEAVEYMAQVDLSKSNDKVLKSSFFATKGDFLYKIGERDSAYATYDTAIEFNPDNYMAMNNCAYFMAVEGSNLGRAELYASIATAAQPENPTFLDTYAWVLFKKKDYTKAREMIDKAIEHSVESADESKGESTEDEISAEVLDHAGDIYFMNGEPREALGFWKKALELEPDNELIRKKVDNKTIFFDFDEEQ